MKRREFLITLVLSATVPCAHAQQPGKLYRIAIVSPSAPVAEITDTGIPTFSALFKELRRLGYVEGQNIVVERYSGAGRTEHYFELANEVVRHKPDLILTISSRMARKLQGRYDYHPHRWTDGRPSDLWDCRQPGTPGGQYHGH